MRKGKFGGSVAAKVVDIIAQDEFLNNVTQQGQHMHNGLLALVDEFPALLKEVRGMGLMIGIECIPDNAYAEIVKIARKHHLLITKAGTNTLRLLPPLIISEKEVEEALSKLRASLIEYSAT